MKKLAIILCLVAAFEVRADAGETPDAVLAGLKNFYTKTARLDGSFAPGIDPTYFGMSDSAASDMAPPTYAVILHRTFGWRLPHEDKTREFLLARQQADGAFVNKAGTNDPKSANARLYNTTQGLVALHGLGAKPRFDPLPVFDAIMTKDYASLPPYTTSFFPLAYATQGKKFPKDYEVKIRALMVQADDGYMHNHIANTFHLAHYYALMGQPTPKAEAILRRCLKDQAANGSWLINPPARDRHATFDAAFTLVHLGKGRIDCDKALNKTVSWVLSCRNADGGFGHYPGSPSDADAVYFHVGTLVLAGWLTPAKELPKDAHLLGWGHLLAGR